MTLLSSILVSGMLKMYSLRAGVGYCGFEMSVAQMLKLHLSFVKVSVAVVAGAEQLLSSALL